MDLHYRECFPLWGAAQVCIHYIDVPHITTQYHTVPHSTVQYYTVLHSICQLYSYTSSVVVAVHSCHIGQIQLVVRSLSSSTNIAICFLYLVTFEVIAVSIPVMCWGKSQPCVYIHISMCQSKFIYVIIVLSIHHFNIMVCGNISYVLFSMVFIVSNAPQRVHAL